MSVRLVVWMDDKDRVRLEDGGSYNSSDLHRSDVKEFLESVGFSYPEPFVSAACYLEGDKRGGVAQAFGKVGAVLDLEAIIARTYLICAGDVQDIGKNGNYHRRKRNKVDKYVRALGEVSGTPEQRIETMRRFVAGGGVNYFEARIDGELGIDDITEFK